MKARKKLPKAKSRKSRQTGRAGAHICFDYVKSSLFRIIHADGAIGGLTPCLGVQLHVWSERFPIPKQVVHPLNPDGTLGQEIAKDRVSRANIIREVEAGIVFDFETAKAVRDWLNERIEEVEKILSEPSRERHERRTTLYKYASHDTDVPTVTVSGMEPLLRPPSVVEAAPAALPPHASHLAEERILETFDGKVERIEGKTAYVAPVDSQGNEALSACPSARLQEEGVGEGMRFTIKVTEHHGKAVIALSSRSCP